MIKTIFAISIIALSLAIFGVSDHVVAAGSGSPEGDQVATKKKRQSRTLTFILKEPNKTQTLSVKFFSRKKISFTLTIAGQCRKTVSGIAPLSETNERELDEKGNPYSAVAYLYEGKNDYVLRVGIADTLNLDPDKAILLEAEDKSGCPVTVKTMRLVIKK